LFGLEKKALRRIYNLKNSRRCAHEHSIGQFNREFNSPVVIGVVKSNRMRYAEHMIRGTEDPPQRVPYRA
jgi:hypothetical protein